MEKWSPGTLGTLPARVTGLGCEKLIHLALASGVPAFAICVRGLNLSKYFSPHLLFAGTPNLVDESSTFFTKTLITNLPRTGGTWAEMGLFAHWGLKMSTLAHSKLDSPLPFDPYLVGICLKWWSLIWCMSLTLASVATWQLVDWLACATSKCLAMVRFHIGWTKRLTGFVGGVLNITTLHMWSPSRKVLSKLSRHIAWAWQRSDCFFLFRRRYCCFMWHVAHPHRPKPGWSGISQRGPDVPTTLRCCANGWGQSSIVWGLRMWSFGQTRVFCKRLNHIETVV